MSVKIVAQDLCKGFGKLGQGAMLRHDEGSGEGDDRLERTECHLPCIPAR